MAVKLAALAAVAGAVLFAACRDTSPPARASTYKDAAYSIAGRTVQLSDGVPEIEAAPGSASRIVTRWLGHEVWCDLDANGRDDVVFLLTQETGGSGTFFHVAAAVDTPSGFVGSQAFPLGDRIAPQGIEVRADGIIVVSYADRARGESFGVPPSVRKTIWLELDPATLQFVQRSR